MDFPAIEPLSMEGFSERWDDTGDISSSTDAGYEITRRRYTRRRKVFVIPYLGLSAGDKMTLDSFIADRGTSGQFYWIHPQTLATHEVRLAKVPDISWSAGLWNCTVELREV